LQRPSSDSRTEAGPNEASGADSRQPDRVDAINQLFAEFELAYHNQYHKAYGDPDRLMLTKKFWLQTLADFSPVQIVAAARQLVRTHEFLPSLAVVIRACEQGHALFGLPTPREAYVEACRASQPKSAWPWSHPAVYQAGKATDWYLLGSEPEDRVFPVFAHYYKQYCQRVMRGEDLAEPEPPALEDNPAKPLSVEEQRAHMEALRKTLKL